MTFAVVSCSAQPTKAIHETSISSLWVMEGTQDSCIEQQKIDAIQNQRTGSDSILTQLNQYDKQIWSKITVNCLNETEYSENNAVLAWTSVQTEPFGGC